MRSSRSVERGANEDLASEAFVGAASVGIDPPPSFEVDRVLARHDSLRDLGAESPTLEEISIPLAERLETRRLLVEVAEDPGLGVVAFAERVEIGGGDSADGEIGDGGQGSSRTGKTDFRQRSNGHARLDGSLKPPGRKSFTMFSDVGGTEADPVCGAPPVETLGRTLRLATRSIRR